MQKGKINALEWELLSKETLESISIDELSNICTKKNVCFPKSILDPGLGPLNSCNLCRTCGCSVNDCTGHNGHLNLTEPCGNVLYYTILPKILHSICIRCSRLLISNHQLKRLKKNDVFKKKLTELHSLSIKNRYCWFDEGEDKKQPILLDREEAKKRGYCGFRQPDGWLRFEKILIRPFYFIDDKSDVHHLPPITPNHIYQILKNVKPEVYELFGSLSSFDRFFFSSLPISSLLIRPSRSAVSEDDLTKNYRDVQCANKYAAITESDLVFGILQQSDKKPSDVIKNEEYYVEKYPSSTKFVRKKNNQKHGVIPECLDSYFHLQRSVAKLLDSNFRVHVDEYASIGRNRLSLKQRYMANQTHSGRVREMINGKRVDLSGRSVISPDTMQDADEVGLPFKNVIKWTIPTTVSPLNYMEMFYAVMNGPEIHPGANFIRRETDRFLPNGNRGGLRLGDSVERHVKEGDVLLQNRQPSLHKYAIMCYRARIHNDNTTKFHLAVMKPIGGDFDGDEITSHVCHDFMSQVEASLLMGVGENMFKDGKLIVGFVQHSAIGVYKLTTTNHLFHYQEVLQLITQGNRSDLTLQVMNRWPKDISYMNGKQVFQLLIPIYNAQNPMTGSSLNTLFFVYMQLLHEDKIPTSQPSTPTTKPIQWLSFITRILESYCVTQGVSITLQDYIAPISTETQQLYHQLCNEANDPNQEEDEIKNCLSRARDVMTRDLLHGLHQQHNNNNGLLDIVLSGAKGSETHIVQSARVVGLQYNGEERNRLSLRHVFPNEIEKYAFIPRSFLQGLTFTQFYYHLQAARMGQIGRNLDTGLTGYLYRRLWKFLEDLHIAFDGSVRNAQQQIIMDEYGFDSCFLMEQSISIVFLTAEELITKYSIDGVDCVPELFKLLELRFRLLSYKQVVTTLATPISVELLKHHLNLLKHNDKRKVNRNKVFGKVVEAWMELVIDYHVPNHDLQEAYWFEMFSTRHLLELGALESETTFSSLIAFAMEKYKQAVCQPGTAVGFLAAQQSIEPLTQAQLKRMASSGECTPLVTGIARVKEITNFSAKIQTPSMTICIKKEYESKFQPHLELVELSLPSIYKAWTDICPECSCLDLVTLTLYVNRAKMIACDISSREFATLLLAKSDLLQLDQRITFHCTKNLYDSEWWISFHVPKDSIIFQQIGKKSVKAHTSLACKWQYLLRNEHCIVRGIQSISHCSSVFTKKIYVVNQDGNYVQEERHFVETVGSNLLCVCLLHPIDLRHTYTNDIVQIYNVFGIDAALQAIERNLYDTMMRSKATISMQHIRVIAYAMCHLSRPIPMTYAGMHSKLSMPNEKVSYIKLASFERSVESFIGAGISGQKDDLKGVSESIFAGTTMSLGTGGHFSCVNIPTNNKSISYWKQMANRLKQNMNIMYINPQKLHNELKTKPIIEIKYDPEPKILKTKKTKLMIYRKQLDDAAKWGTSLPCLIPPSPERKNRKIEWNMNASCLIPASP